MFSGSPNGRYASAGRQAVTGAAHSSGPILRHRTNRTRVSIRSRHRCREKLPRVCWARSTSACFNPLPASMPGETLRHPPIQRRCRVSIRSRHRCREKHVGESHTGRLAEFQSAPGIDAGRNPSRRSPRTPTTRFNPLPALMPGETRAADAGDRLARRFQSAPGIDAGRNRLVHARSAGQWGFNPLPASMPGETVRSATMTGWCGFQSAPGIDAGRNRPFRIVCERDLRFNPLPALMPGETWTASVTVFSGTVSIRSRH